MSLPGWIRRRAAGSVGGEEGPDYHCRSRGWEGHRAYPAATATGRLAQSLHPFVLDSIQPGSVVHTGVSVKGTISEHSTGSLGVLPLLSFHYTCRCEAIKPDAWPLMSHGTTHSRVPVVWRPALPAHP